MARDCSVVTVASSILIKILTNRQKRAAEAVVVKEGMEGVETS